MTDLQSSPQPPDAGARDRRLKIAVFGAGAIGGYLALMLHKAGVDVCLVARGAHLDAIRGDGLTVVSGGHVNTVRIPATDTAADLGRQDYVFVTLKANGLAAASKEIARLMDAATVLVPAINGIPYWYFHGLSGPWKDRPVTSVDPDGAVWKTLPPRQVLGCIVYPAAQILAPGRVQHLHGNRFVLGEPDGALSPRAQRLSRLMAAAGMDAPVRANIRDEIWLKLLANLAFNPLSALTGATLDRLALQPALRSVAGAMMQEGRAVAAALEARIGLDDEAILDAVGAVGPHKTSMLKDLEAGRPLEIDALLGAVVELADLTGQAIPLCRSILALVREKSALRGRGALE